MLRLFVDVLVALLGLAVLETFVKPAVVWGTQKLTRKYLPELLNRMDAKFPDLVKEKTGYELEKLIFHEIFDMAEEEGDSLSQSQILAIANEFRKAYDPVIAADKYQAYKKIGENHGL